MAVDGGIIINMIHKVQLKCINFHVNEQKYILGLSGTSIGNHQNISFTDTLTIEKLTQDSLILKRGELLLKYARNNEALNQETIPAAVLTPAKKLLSVKGELVIGHEVRSFKAEGDSADY